MSAVIRQCIQRGVALNVIRTQRWIRPSASVLSAARLYSKKSDQIQPHELKSNAKTEDAVSNDASRDNKSIFDRLVRSNKVVVFMKGSPRSPRCGFSNAVVQIFRMHGVEYDAHDVLANSDIREGIKKYTDWPTIPQVFINGEFIGGCDILLEMHQNGELIETLGKAGIVSHLLKIEESAKEKNTKNNDSNN